MNVASANTAPASASDPGAPAGGSEPGTQPGTNPGTGARSVHGAGPMPTIEDLVSQHSARIWRVLRRMGLGVEDAEDLCQETFVVAHRRLSTFDGQSRVETWLCGIALNLARDFLNASAGAGPGSPRAGSARGPGPRPRRPFGRAGAPGISGPGLATLSEEQRLDLCSV